MKKQVSLLLLIAMVVVMFSGMTSFAEAKTIWEMNFNDLAAGKQIGTKEGFTAEKRAEGDMMGVFNKDFATKEEFNGYAYLSKDFASNKNSGKASLEFDYRPSAEGNANILVYLYGNDSDDAGTKNAPFPYVATILGTNKIENIIAKSQGSPVSLTAGTFVKVKYEIDLEKYTYDVYIDGVKKGTAWPFRENANFASAYSGPSPINGGVNLSKIIIMNPAPAGEPPFKVRAAIDNIKYSAADGETGGTPVATAKPSGGGTSDTPGKMYYENNFDNDKPGAAPATYSEIAAGKGKLSIVQKSTTDNCIEILDEADDATYGWKIPVSDITGRFTMAFDFRRSAESKGSPMLYIYDDPAGFPPGPAMFFNAKFGAFNGSENKGTETVIAPDKWIKAVVDVNPETQKYSVYIDGKEAVKDFGFRNDKAKTITSIQFAGSINPSPIKFNIDNIKVYAGAPSSADLAAAPVETSNTGPVSAAEGQMPAYKDIESKLRKELLGTVSLFVDKPVAMVNADHFAIDPNNSAVVPFVINDRTLVPVRFISEAFGADVKWDEALGKVTATLSGTTVEMSIGSDIMYVNGQEKKLDVVANTYNDRTFIPLRAMVESLGKKVFWDDRGLIMIGDKENPLSDSYMYDLMCMILISAKEAKGYAPYSSVFLSSRWYWGTQGADPNHVKTLDVLKRYMATADKWSYITDKKQIESMVNLGMSFEGCLNTITGTKGADGHIPGGVRTLEGNPSIAPWMTWGSPWACLNSTEYNKVVREVAYASIDAGATEFQHDDGAGNVSLFSWGTGCFCDECVADFTEYLKINVSKEDLSSKYEISDINSFNYKKWLNAKGITTDKQYISEWNKIPLHQMYVKFQRQVTDDYYANLKLDMAKYAGTKIATSTNDTPFIFSYIANERQNFARRNFDYGISEHSEGAWGIENIVAAGRIYNTIGTPEVISPVNSAKNPFTLRPGIAAAYAFGQYMLVPWDIWHSGTAPRYYGDIYTYGDMYQFIRENAYLFDAHDINAKVGVLSNWDTELTLTNASRYQEYVMKLFANGIPYEALMVAYDEQRPQYNLTKEQLGGLDYIVTYSTLDKLSDADRKVVEESGIKLVSLEEANDAWMQTMKKATVTSNIDGVLHAIPRQMAGESSVHIINTNGYVSPQNITVNVDEAFAPGQKAYVYRPGYDAVELPVTVNNGVKQVSFDKISEWAIVAFTNDLGKLKSQFSVSSEFTGFAMGNPTAWGSAYGNTDSMTLASKGIGVNVNAVGDEGSQDSGTFVYRHIESSVIDDFEISAKINEFEGQAGLMIREMPSSNSPFVGIRNIKGKGLVMDVRTKHDMGVSTTALNTDKPYIKIVKKGTEYSVYASDDGANFGAPLHKVSVVLKTAVAGTFLASGNIAKETKGSFSEIKYNFLPTTLKTQDVKNLTVKTFNGDENIMIKKGNSSKFIIKAEINGTTVTIPGKNIEASSIDNAVAEVFSDGTVSAKTQGKVTAKFILKLSDGNLEKTATIESVNELVVFKEDFERFAVDSYLGDDPSKIWRCSLEKDDAKARIINGDNNSGKCLYLYTEGPNNMNPMASLPSLKGDFTLEFDQKIEFTSTESGHGARVIYIDGSAMGISLFCHSDGYKWFDNKDMHTIEKYEAAKWRHHRIDVNIGTTKSMNWYIDGVLVAENAPFRNPIEAATTISFGTTTNAHDTRMWLDNIVAIQK